MALSICMFRNFILPIVSWWYLALNFGVVMEFLVDVSDLSSGQFTLTLMECADIVVPQG